MTLRRQKSASFTREIGEFAVDIEFADLPTEVVRQAKFCIMDTFGSIIGSLKIGFESGRLIARHIGELGGRKESTIFGHEKKVPYLNAALANSSLQCDLDDFHMESGCHIASITVPAALCIAERDHKSGKEFITALVAGYDVTARVGIATNPSSLYMRGFHPTSVCGPFGCAIAAGKLLRLEENQMVHALGIAGVQGAGLTNWREGESVFFQSAKAAQSGVLAASLAQKGLTGLTNILEDEKGFCKTFSEKSDLTKLTEDLGNRFEIMGTSVKRYLCCTHTHSGIEGLIELLRENQLASQDIEKIILNVPLPVVSLLDSCKPPSSPLMAAMNGRYIMSTTVRLKEAMEYNAEVFLGEGRNDPRNYEFFDQVSIVGDPKLNEGESVVKIHAKDGKNYLRHKNSAKGSPGQPLTKEELENKFRKLANYVLPKQTTAKIVEAINRLDRIEDINVLTEIIAETTT